MEKFVTKKPYNFITAKVHIKPKKGVLDPQGKAIKNSLLSLGYKDINDVRVGRYIELELKDLPYENVGTIIKEMCERLLANPIIEDYFIEIEE